MTFPKPAPSRGWLFRAIPIAVLGVVAAAILASLFVGSSPPKSTVLYKGRSLDDWFYGARTNFLVQQTRADRKEALQGAGTNAFPFLLSKLQRPGGHGALYCKFYSALPAWARERFPYSVAADDIRVVALGHIRQINRLPPDQVQALAGIVPALGNPQVRMSGFDVMRSGYQAHPAFLQLCRKLLDDKHPGIQLEAAIYLGNSALASDPHEPRLFPILIAGYESKEVRKARLDVGSYRYQLSVRFARVRLPAALPPYYSAANEDQMLQSRIEDALLRLERYMPPEQKERWQQVEKEEKESRKRSIGR